MKTNKIRSRWTLTHTVILSSAILLLLGVGVAAYYTHHQLPKSSGTKVAPPNTINYSPSQPSDNKASAQQKGQPPAGQSAAPAQSPTTPAAFTVTVTRATVDGPDKVVVIGTLVNGVTSGTCTLQLSQPGQQTITLQQQVALQTNNYSCQNFIVPFSKFPHSGNWGVHVVLINGNQTAAADWPSGVTILGQ